MRTRLPRRTRVTRVTRATSSQPAPTVQSSPMTQPGPTRAPASTRERAPMVTNGPIVAPASTTAVGSTTAEGWTPGATVAGTVYLGATASDSNGVAQVKWYVDGVEVAYAIAPGLDVRYAGDGDLETLRVSKDGFFHLVTQFPQIGIEVMHELASRLDIGLSRSQ